MISHTGTILTSTPSHQHDAVLLHVVTLAGNVRGDNLAIGQAHFGRLALARVGFLGFCDAHFQTHAFHLRTLLGRKGRGHGVAGFLGSSAIGADLIEGRAACGRGAEESRRRRRDVGFSYNREG